MRWLSRRVPHVAVLLACGAIPTVAATPPPAAPAAGVAFSVLDPLRFTLLAESPTTACSFVVFSTAGSIDQFDAVLKELKDPRGQEIAPEAKALRVARDHDTVTPDGTRVSLVAVNALLKSTGEYRATLLLKGVDGQKKPLAHQVMVNLVRPGAQINLEELKNHEVQLTRWWPIGAPNEIRLQLQETTGKTDLIDPVPLGGHLDWTDAAATVKRAAPGNLAVSLVPAATIPAGRSADMLLKFSGLWQTGAFVTQVAIQSPSLEAPQVIPLKVRVSDAWLLPLLVICLGVWGGYWTHQYAQRDRPRRLNDLLIARLRGEIRELEGRVTDPGKREQLRAQEQALQQAAQKNRLGDPAGAKTELDAIATALHELRKGETAAADQAYKDLLALKAQVEQHVARFDAPAGEDPQLLPGLRDALEQAASRLQEDRVDAARAELASAGQRFDQLRTGRLRQRLSEFRDRLARLADAPADERKTVEDALDSADGLLEQGKLDEVSTAVAALFTDLRRLERLHGPPQMRGARPEDAPPAPVTGTLGIAIREAPERWRPGEPITFLLEDPDNLLRPDDRVRWHVEGGVPPQPPPQRQITVRFAAPGTYRVQALVTRSTPTGDLLIDSPSRSIAILPEPLGEGVSAIEAEIHSGDRALSGGALVLAVVTGLLYLYVDKSFGSMAEYLGALLWGFGIENGVRGFAAVSKQITTGG